MFVNSNEISEKARVWVYSANRFFKESELPLIQEKIKSFLSRWTAHNKNLESTFAIRYNRHIIIAVDEESAKASGCSIDSCVKFIQALGEEHDFDGLDRLNYTFIDNNAPYMIEHHNLNAAFQNKEIQLNTPFVNPLVKNWKEYKDSFLVSLKNSFLIRFIDAEIAKT
ncbi:MAG TPA: hypothetical protein VJ951_08115 [Bacteroidales bacterium]|nr:hypothetical protein [Bacteroidales bacterium]